MSVAREEAAMNQAAVGRNQRIRELAYLLWREEGCPEGEAERHWFAAEALYEAEDAERKTAEGKPPGDGERSATAPAPKRKPTASRSR